MASASLRPTKTVCVIFYSVETCNDNTQRLLLQLKDRRLVLTD